jgi:hypothetical protein
MWLAPFIQHSKKKKEGEVRSPAVAVSLLAVMVALALVAFTYLGFFSRYLADDYCFARQVIDNGFWGAQIHSYLTWSDRFSSTFFNTLINYSGLAGIQLLPGLLIVMLTAATILLLRKVRQFSEIPLSESEIFASSALFTYLSLYSAPDLFQALFWRAGSITYLLPLSLMIFGLVLALARLDHKPTVWLPALILLVFFIAGGFSETNLALQTGLIALILAGGFFRSRKFDFKQPITIHLLAALAGSLIALAVMLVSPGNSVRMEAMPARPDLIRWVGLSIRFALGYFYQTVRSYPAPIVATGLMCFILALLKPWKLKDIRQIAWLFWVLPVGLLLAVIAICSPSAYVQSAFPEGRALISARWCTIAAVGVWFYLAGVWLVNRLQVNKGFDQIKLAKNASFVLVMISFYVIYGALQALAYVPARQSWADAWDKRAVQIANLVADGQRDIVVAPLDSVERLKELDDDPQHWVNKCAAVFYGVDRISAK